MCIYFEENYNNPFSQDNAFARELDYANEKVV